MVAEASYAAGITLVTPVAVFTVLSPVAGSSVSAGRDRAVAGGPVPSAPSGWTPAPSASGPASSGDAGRSGVRGGPGGQQVNRVYDAKYMEVI